MAVLAGCCGEQLVGLVVCSKVAGMRSSQSMEPVAWHFEHLIWEEMSVLEA
jgi:hypothetical protein